MATLQDELIEMGEARQPPAAGEALETVSVASADITDAANNDNANESSTDEPLLRDVVITAAPHNRSPSPHPPQSMEPVASAASPHGNSDDRSTTPPKPISALARFFGGHDNPASAFLAHVRTFVLALRKHRAPVLVAVLGAVLFGLLGGLVFKPLPNKAWIAIAVLIGTFALLMAETLPIAVIFVANTVILMGLKVINTTQAMSG